MIKGINRQMIEIIDTGNPYFERALLVVQPQLSETDEDTLRDAARDMLRKTGSCSQLRLQRRRRFWYQFILITLSGGVGAALALLIEKLLGL